MHWHCYAAPAPVCNKRQFCYTMPALVHRLPWCAISKGWDACYAATALQPIRSSQNLRLHPVIALHDAHDTRKHYMHRHHYAGRAAPRDTNYSTPSGYVVQDTCDMGQHYLSQRHYAALVMPKTSGYAGDCNRRDKLPRKICHTSAMQHWWHLPYARWAVMHHRCVVVLAWYALEWYARGAFHDRRCASKLVHQALCPCEEKGKKGNENVELEAKLIKEKCSFVKYCKQE